MIATPNGLGFIDREAVEAQTGYPIRSAWRTPSIPQPLPPADAIAVAPATFNTINKWAAGISDTLALGILCEAYGLGIPVAVQPYVNSAQAAHNSAPNPATCWQASRSGSRSSRVAAARLQSAP